MKVIIVHIVQTKIMAFLRVPKYSNTYMLFLDKFQNDRTKIASDICLVTICLSYSIAISLFSPDSHNDLATICLEHGRYVVNYLNLIVLDWLQGHIF